MEEQIINGKEFRLVVLRNRGKWIAKDGEAYNPCRKNQKASIHINSDGYPCFGGGVPVHLYVAHAWVDGWHDGAEVDHIDYDRMNYSSENLRWVSHTENIVHSSMDVNHYVGNNSGSLNGRAVLTNEEVATAKKLFSDGLSVTEVIKWLYPDADYVSRKKMWNRFNRIRTGETWSN